MKKPITRFQSADMGPLRAGLRRHLKKFDNRLTFRVGDIEWYDDHCWVSVRVGIASDQDLVGHEVEGYEIIGVVPGQKKPYRLRKEGKEYVAGPDFVENALTREKHR